MAGVTEDLVRRSDAERNRDRILRAARAMITRRDGAVSMAEVARQAGVGMATLYRNFPGMKDLLEGLYAGEVDEICAAAVDSADAPGEAFLEWVRRFGEFHESKHPIAAELLRHTDRTDPIFEDSRARVVAAGRALLTAAQDAGEIRTDITVEQVLDLVLAAATVRGDRAYVDPILRTVMNGLRPR